MRNILFNEIDRIMKLILKKEGKNHFKEKIYFQLEPPKEKIYGDYFTNIAFVLSKYIDKSPFQIANEILSYISFPNDILQKIEVVPPGFINFYISKNNRNLILKEILSNKHSFGKSSIGNDQSILIEFVSANPTGPLHIGHGRCAAFGDSLSNLLKIAGYNVSKEYYINDSGKQIDILSKSVFSCYCKHLNSSFSFPDNGYRGEYINQIALNIINNDGRKYLNMPEDEAIKLFRTLTSDIILEINKDDLHSFGVDFDSWFSETSLLKDNKVLEILNILRKKGIVYEKDDAIWIRTSNLGDEKDRVVIKSNGEMTYFSTDIAYHHNKLLRGFHRLINIWGADHHGYINRIKSIIKALDFSDENIDFLLIQMVKLIKDGKQIDMSTRKGTFITLDELINEVGKDAARFFFLLRRHDSQLEFDLDLAKQQSSENPVYYCQYAHARISSIESNIKEFDVDSMLIDNIDISLINLPEELDIIKKLEEFPYMIESASNSLEPHKVTYYLIELSTLFHKYYNAHRVISPDSNLTMARLALIQSVKYVIKNCLNILGVSAPQKM